MPPALRMIIDFQTAGRQLENAGNADLDQLSGLQII